MTDPTHTTTDPWDGAEPAVILAEVQRCNGTTITGGAVAHTKRCPLHGITPDSVSQVIADLRAQLATAHSDGYQQAITRLRDAAVGSIPPAPHLTAAANFLEQRGLLDQTKDGQR